MYQPYTYLIAWTHLDKFYYGVRYSKSIEGKTPEQDLWVDYFTSSKYVKEFREMHGEPDRIEIRQVFDSAEKARNWEKKFLERTKIYDLEECLNKSNSRVSPIPGSFWITNGLGNYLVSSSIQIPDGWEKGRTFSKDWKKKISDARKGVTSPNKGKRLSKSQRDKLSDIAKNRTHHPMQNRKHSEDTRKKMSAAKKGKTWATNGKNIILVDSVDCIPAGFKPGRKLNN